MRKLLIYILFTSMAVSAYGVDYQTVTYSALPTQFSSTSAYTVSSASSYGSVRIGATSSFSAISSSNFVALNSEGGLCYNPGGASRRAGKKPDVPPIGENEEEFPIGDTPWILFGLLLIAYGAFKWKKKSAEI